MAGAKNTTIVDIKDVKKLIQILLTNWYVFIICFCISLVSSYLYSYRLPVIYAAKSQLLLKTPETYPIQQGLFQGLGIYSSQYEKMSNEQRVLTSTDVISQTVSKLNLDVSYYIVGRIQTQEFYAGSPFLVDAKIYSPGYYEFPFTLKIKSADQFEISFEQNGKQVILKQKFGEPIINNNYYFLINKTAALNSQTFDSFKEITYQFKVHNRSRLVYSYKSALSVSNVEWTAILELTMEDKNEDRAVAFLDTLCKVYINNSLKTKLKVNDNTISYIDKQLDEVITILDSIETMMETFKDEKNILNLSKEEETYFRSLTGFEVAKRNYELQIKSMEYLKNYITSNMNKELLPPSLYIEEGSDGYLKKAITELYNNQVKINSMMFTTTDQSTSVKEIEYQIELLRNDILKYLVNSDKAIKEKIQAIDGEIAYYEGLLKGVPLNQRQMLNINRKIQVNEKMYLYLLEKRAETVIAKAGIVPEISIVESGHSIGAVKPDKNKIYYSAISFGMIAALLIAFIRSLFFTKIQNIDELRELTQQPILGEVYFTKEAKDGYMIVDSHPRSFVTESFRAIRTNLEYLATEAKSKVVLITSNRPGVGKTFCSINLGAILAKGGKKVLLLELDLHKPKIHSALKITSELGITSVLIGKVENKQAVINSGIENMDVILSGPTPPNASELILSDNLRKLFDYARVNYDYVIVDTPPMGIISDALMLMKYSDANIFIINAKYNPNEGLRYALDFMENNKVKSFSFVLNNVRPRFSRYYYKRYKYSYGYGYHSDTNELSDKV